MTLNSPFIPTSTTTFNSYHPTTTLGNNVSTNTNQYATVGYVNGYVNNANIWTGTNAFNSYHPTTTLGNNTSTNTTQYATVGYVNGYVNTAISASSFSCTGGSTQVNYSVDTANSINIIGISNANFFTSAGLPTNDYILIGYKFIQFDNLLTTIYSSTGTLMLFPQRIGSYTSTGRFGQYAQPTLYKQYNINNGINGNTAFNDVNATYSANNRQYWNCCPAGGQNSGFSTTPTSFFVLGTTLAGNTAGGATASYGFTLTPISTTTTFTYTLAFEVVYNPFPSTIVINNYLNSQSQSHA